MSLFFSIILLLFSYLPVQETGTTNIAGVYKGRPLFVQNAYDPDSREFCIRQIKVNDRDITFNRRVSAIKLDFEGVTLYSPVVIKIFHKDSCSPIIVNPDAIFFHSVFSFEDIIVTDSVLIWKTKGEKEGGSFSVEKIDMGLWQEESVVEAKGIFGGAEYRYDHQIEEGTYKFRIKYNFPNGKHLYSHEIDFHFYPDPVTFKPARTKRMIYFSRVALYQIYDAGGDLVMEGTAKEADVSKLPSGEYVIYFNEKDPGTFTRE